MIFKNRFTKKLPNVTLVAIDCNNIKRIQKVLDISAQKIEFGKVKLLTSLPTNDSRKVKIPPIKTIEAYSEFCIKKFTDYIDTDFALLIQHDGFILNPHSWTDEFLDYDYIGPPWFAHEEFWFKEYDFPERLRDTLVVGNGGFCLRSKKFMDISKDLAEKELLKDFHPEDISLCIWHRKLLENAGIRFAPPEVAKKFGIEGLSFKYDKQFGFHNLKWTDISKWIRKNPEWNIRLNLKK